MKVWKLFVRMKEVIQQNEVTMAPTLPFTFGGTTSDMTIQGRGPIPRQYEQMYTMTHTRGSQLMALTSRWSCSFSRK